MAFYANTVAGHAEAEWEPLSRHLTEVAGLAAQRGERFGAREVAELAGLLHDLGKYSAEF
jgi:CRISPR-associated endonuclease/helicase Cas3